MPYVSRDGMLVFVPADALSISDRVVVPGTSAGRQRISLWDTWARFVMPYVSRDGMLVFVPADALSISDRVVVPGTSAGSKRSIELLRELGKGTPLHEDRMRDGRGGPSAFESATVVSTVSD